MSPQVNSHKHEEQEDPDRQKSFWAVRCESGKTYCRELSNRCNITMAALEPNTSNAENSEWLSLMMEHKSSQYLLCSLKHDAVMQVPLNLIFEKGVKMKFSVKGQGTVHLTGFQEGSSADTEVNETDQKEDKEEDCSTVGKTIKNGQIFCKICDTFIKSEPFWRKHIQKKNHIKNLKLGKVDKSSCSSKNIKSVPSTSNSMSPDDEDSSEIEEIPPNMPSGSSGKAGSGVVQVLSKGLRKQLSQIDDDDEDDEEDQDFNASDEEESEEDDDDEDSDDDVEEEDDDDDDSNESGGMVNKALEAQKRKREAEALTGSKRAKKSNSMSEASTSNASQMPVEIFVEDDEEDEESSSEEESEDSSDVETSVCKKSPLVKNAQPLNKKKKSNDSVQQIDSNSKPNSGKADDSLQVTDLRVGYGPPAKAGKMVQVFYVGKHMDGTTFDQTELGKPFSFKLGAGQVIKGWDMGVEGMKVGGKRKIKIPPHLGYGNKEMDGVPANSTLIFVVELKSIS